MALKLSKKTEFGVEADYWKVTIMSVDNRTKEVDATVGLFLNKKCAGDSKPMETVRVTFNNNHHKNFTELGGDISALYKILAGADESPLKGAADA